MNFRSGHWWRYRRKTGAADGGDAVIKLRLVGKVCRVLLFIPRLRQSRPLICISKKPPARLEFSCNRPSSTKPWGECLKAPLWSKIHFQRLGDAVSTSSCKFASFRGRASCSGLKEFTCNADSSRVSRSVPLKQKPLKSSWNILFKVFWVGFDPSRCSAVKNECVPAHFNFISRRKL